MTEHNIVLFADNDLLIEVLNENFKFANSLNIVKQDWQQFLDNVNKVDLLIVDLIIGNTQLPIYKIKNIINLTNHTIHSEEIQLYKPIRLIELAKLIDKTLGDNLLFSPIGSYIYNEFAGSLNNKNSAIKLTDKENAVISYLIKHNHSASKLDLFQAVWHYHENTETSTFETHIYKLKQKLPEGMLKIQGDNCFLNIME